MPRAIEDHSCQIANAFGFGLGDPSKILSWAGRDVDDAEAIWTDRDLVHVERWTRIEHRTFFANGDYRKSVVAAVRSQGRPVDRVDGHIDMRFAPVADDLAVVEHGRFVFFAFADDDCAGHLHARET